MVTLSVIGIIWALVAVVFVWMIVRYGISQGKQHDTAKEFETSDKEELRNKDRKVS